VLPAEGERVVTSAQANAFPADLPIGTVHYSANKVPEVEPLAQLDRLEVVRLFDYGLHGGMDPEVAAARPTGERGQSTERLLDRPAPDRRR
jgi:rod shape-determining protein MreC